MLPSSLGRYAIGERRTMLVILSTSFSLDEFEKTINSLLSVMNSPKNRVYVDILVADTDLGRFDLEKWRARVLQDYSLQGLQSNNLNEVVQHLESKFIEHVVLLSVCLIFPFYLATCSHCTRLLRISLSLLLHSLE